MAGLPEPKARLPPVPKPRPEPKAEPDAFTFRQLPDAFLADAKVRLKPFTVESYAHDAEEFADAFGTAQADRITPPDVSLWLAKLKVSETTKAIRLRAVSACFGSAVRLGLLAEGPVKRVPKPKARSRSEEAVIGPADRAKLSAVASPEFRLVLQVLHGTGCRPGETCRITAENFDAANGVAKLREHKTDRTGRPRLVFVPPDASALLKAQADRTGPLLRSKARQPWTARSITQAMNRLQRKAGVR
jgi:integrase